MTTQNQPNDILDTAAVAAMIGCTPATLATWRCTKAVQIPFIKVGRLVRYRRRDVENWLDQNTKGTQ